MFFITYYVVTLVVFLVGLAFAWTTLSKLRNTSATYNARLLPFAYYSLSSWILWVLQYLLLIASPFISFPDGFFLNTGLWLGLVQDALWASAVLSLYSKQFSRLSLTLPSLIAFTIVVYSITYGTTVLASFPFALIDGLSGAIFFGVFAYSSAQWRLSKISGGAFLVHGLTQWIWRSLWFAPLAEAHPATLLLFPLWRIALLFAWIGLISAILQRAQPSYETVVNDIQRLDLPNPLDPLLVMISSTVGDLAQERDAADRAILGLHLKRFRAETFGSLAHTPETICAFMAERCDLFILIIGERYGSTTKSGISVVEFEYGVAHTNNPGKILVYVKDGVVREPHLEKFLKRVEDFEYGHFRSLFTTPEDLYERIHRDVARWLTLRVKQIHSK